MILINHYYLEKMMEMKKREMEHLAKESSRENSSFLLNHFLQRKKRNQIKFAVLD
jgi:hypothetical protein